MTDIDPKSDIELCRSREHVVARVPLSAEVSSEWIRCYQRLARAMDVPVAGFDVSSEVLDAIKSGKIIATVDQQPYSQGFYAVTELALEIKYGLYPANIKTGGEGLVDKTNYEPAVKYAGKYR